MEESTRRRDERNIKKEDGREGYRNEEQYRENAEKEMRG